MIYLYQFLFLTLTYLISSIPFGLLVAKVFSGKDIREIGSKNIGATNVARTLGKKLGAITLILDGIKGALMVITARFLFSDVGFLNTFLILVGTVAVLGHIFPIYLKFKGGKGVATSLAVLLALNPIIGLVGLLAWIIVFIFTKISSISSLSSALMITGFAFYSHTLFEEILFCVFLTTVIFIRHRENISRILKGKETRFKFSSKK
jgi:glycerol-3-phosphate acyltransferase PlsY